MLKIPTLVSHDEPESEVLLHARQSDCRLLRAAALVIIFLYDFSGVVLLFSRFEFRLKKRPGA